MNDEKFFIHCFCSKVGNDVIGFIGCGEDVVIGEDDLYPRYLRWDNRSDEFLHFYMKCPKCGCYRYVHKDFIPSDIKRRVVSKYWNVIDQISYRLYLEEERFSLLSQFVKTCNKIDQFDSKSIDDDGYHKQLNQKSFPI